MHRFSTLPLLKDRPVYLSRCSQTVHITTTTWSINPAIASHPRYPSPFPRNYYSTAKMAATDATMRTFFASPHYAVSGASTNPDKWGYKVFKWYVTRKLSVTPINPSAKTIKVGSQDLPTVSSISELENPKETSLSIITAPFITINTLKEAKELGIPSVWLQPGTFDDEVLTFARASFKAVVAGEGGHGGEGWCVLVDGDRGLQSVQKL